MRPGGPRDTPDEATTDWRAVCGKTARAVRRAGRAHALPDPYQSGPPGHPRVPDWARCWNGNPRTGGDKKNAPWVKTLWAWYYLHDGRLLTLADTVEFFNLTLGLKLTQPEKASLVAYMLAL